MTKPDKQPHLPFAVRMEQMKGDITQAIRNMPHALKENAPEYGKTAAQATVLMLAEHIALPVLESVTKRFGVDLVNRKNDAEAFKLVDEYPVLGTLLTTGVGPLIEELIFREGLPKGLEKLLKPLRPKDEDDLNWKLGIPLAVLFALIHNVDSDQKEEKVTLKIQTDTIPLGQFLGGVFLWYLRRKKGFDHALLGHAVHNTTYLLLEKVLDSIDSPHSIRRQVKEKEKN